MFTKNASISIYIATNCRIQLTKNCLLTQMKIMIKYVANLAAISRMNICSQLINQYVELSSLAFLLTQVAHQAQSILESENSQL